MVSVYLALFTAPLVLGSWVVLQRTRVLLAGLWLALLLVLLIAALVTGAVGLFALGSTPGGAIRAA
jgi:hypothetical protein